MGDAPKLVSELASAEALAAEISRLYGLSMADLRVAWQKAFRRPAPAALWRNLLLRTLAWRLQETVFGGHDKATERLFAGYGKQEKARVGKGKLNQRLKTGTVLVRDFEGVRHTVTLVPEGFIWQEKRYASLSAIAKLITGTSWNGPRFFGLREGKQVDSGQKRAA